MPVYCLQLWLGQHVGLTDDSRQPLGNRIVDLPGQPAYFLKDRQVFCHRFRLLELGYLPNQSDDAWLTVEFDGRCRLFRK